MLSDVIKYKEDMDMSGRKSTEVNSLLARGKNARESGNGNYLRNISGSKTILRKNQKKINEIVDRIDSKKIQICSESINEFPEESRELQEKYESIKKANVKVDYEQDIAKAEKEQKEIDAKLSKADKEHERIRDRIRNKNGYCDEEYKDAGKLVEFYKKISEKKNALIAKLKRKVQKSNTQLVEYQSLDNQMDQVMDAEKKLNDRAISIVELREKASESKKYIQKCFESVNSDSAMKFCESEYLALQQETVEFCNMTDAEVMKNVTSISEKISIFSYKVDSLLSEYLEKYEKLESSIKSAEEMLSVKGSYYFDPIDYFKHKDESNKITVLDYLKEYSDKENIIKSVNSYLSSSKQFLEEEKFEECEKMIDQLNIEINKANEYASLLQEHLIENFYVAKDMTNVMKKMGFSTGAKKIDGHIKNGWKISASNPNGENIDFTKVFKDDDGNMKIEIDHKTVGDCPSKWSDITAEMAEVGIYFETITMENGTSVINRRKKKVDNEGVAEGKDRQVRSRS